MKSPVFQIIRDFLIKREEHKSKCFLRNTESNQLESKQYYIIFLANNGNNLNILGRSWKLRGQHISIYEDQTWSEKNFQSTYHYTGSFICDKKKIIVHAYFDRNGKYCYCHVKDENNIRIEINPFDDNTIQLYAEAASILVISAIQAEANRISNDFEDKFDVAMQQLTESSRELAEGKESSIKFYLENVDQCLVQLQYLQQYSYNPRDILQENLLRAKKYLSNKLEILIQSNKDPVDDLKDIEEAKTESEQSLNRLKRLNLNHKKSIDKKTNLLTKIEEQLNDLSIINNPVDCLVKHYELLLKKFELLKSSDEDTVLSVFAELNNKRAILRVNTIEAALNGDLFAVKTMSAYVEDLPNFVFFWTIAQGYVEMVEFLLKNYRFNINQINIVAVKGTFVADTPILTAVRFNHINIVDLLLKNKANPNIKNPFVGQTALMEAVESNRFEIAELLLRHKADPNLQPQREKAFICTTNAKLAMLISKFSQNKDPSQTALHRACALKRIKFVKLLLQHQADWTLRDKGGATPFMLNAMWRDQPLNEEIALAFLEKGLDIDILHPTHSYSSLFYACQENRLESVKFLIDHGADPNLACVPIKNVLKADYEIDFSTVGFKSKHFALTPFMKAAQKDHVDILKYLVKQKHFPVTKENSYDAYILAKLSCATDSMEFLERTFGFVSVEHYANNNNF